MLYIPTNLSCPKCKTGTINPKIISKRIIEGREFVTDVTYSCSYCDYVDHITVNQFMDDKNMI